MLHVIKDIVWSHLYLCSAFDQLNALTSWKRKRKYGIYQKRNSARQKKESLGQIFVIKFKVKLAVPNLNKHKFNMCVEIRESVGIHQRLKSDFETVTNKQS